MAAVFTFLGAPFGFKRNRGGAQFVKCARDDGAPTLLMRPRPGGPPLYEKDIEVHVSATREFGLAVTIARADAGSDAMIGDILNEACENVDLARDKKWVWWSGEAVPGAVPTPKVAPAPDSTQGEVAPKPGTPPVVAREPVPTEGQARPEQGTRGMATPEVSTSPAVSSPKAPEQTAQPVRASAPEAPSQVDEAKLAVALARQVAPWFAVGFAVLGAVVWLFLHYQHAGLLAVLSRQQGVDRHVALVDDSPSVGGALGQRRLPLIDGQARPPCHGLGREIDDGCWIEVAAKPPCPEMSIEKNGKCWVAQVDKKHEPRSGDAH